MTDTFTFRASWPNTRGSPPGQKKTLWQGFLDTVRNVVSSLAGGPSPSRFPAPSWRPCINSIATLIDRSQSRGVVHWLTAQSQPEADKSSWSPIPVTEVSPDLDSAALATRDVSAQNSVQDALEQLYQAWNHFGHNPAGVTFDDWLGSHNFISLDNTPKELVEAINRHLAGAGHSAVSLDLKLADVPSDSMRKRAASVAHRILSDVWVTMSDRRKSAEWNISSRNPSNIVDRLSRNNAQLHGTGP